MYYSGDQENSYVTGQIDKMATMALHHTLCSLNIFFMIDNVVHVIQNLLKINFSNRSRIT